MTSLAALVGLEVAALLVLHHLGSYEVAAVGWSDLSGWLAQAPPEDAFVAVVRLAALALAWWLTASTLLYVLASVARIPALVRGVRWATVAPVRRMIDGALATTIFVGSTFGTVGVATASPTIRPAVVVELNEPNGGSPEPRSPVYQPHPAGDGEQVGYEPTPAGASSTGPTSTTVPRDPSPSTIPQHPEVEVPTVTSPTTYVVRPGDNLWAIAKNHLAELKGPDEDLHIGDVQNLWLQIIEANNQQLRSGDPNLIVHGEVVQLPDRSDAGVSFPRCGGHVGCGTRS